MVNGGFSDSTVRAGLEEGRMGLTDVAEADEEDGYGGVVGSGGGGGGRS